MNLAPTRTLVLVNLLAMAGLASLWIDKNGAPRNTTWTAPAPVKPVISPLSESTNPSNNSNDASQFAATLERPIFTPDRRPPPPVLAPPPPPPSDPLADVRLLGLFAGDAGGVLIKSEERVRRVALHQKLGDWTLESIGDREATFVRAEEKRVVRMGYAALGPLPQGLLTAGNAVIPSSAPATTPGISAPQAAALQRQNEEQDATQRRVEAMRAQMRQKKP